MLFVFTLRAHQAVFARRSFVTILLIPLSSEKCVEGVARDIQKTLALTTILSVSYNKRWRQSLNIFERKVMIQV